MNFPTQEAIDKKKPKRLRLLPKAARINPIVLRTMQYKSQEHVIEQTDDMGFQPKIKGMLPAKTIQSIFDFASYEMALLMQERDIEKCECFYWEENQESVLTFNFTPETIIEILIREV